jgi:F-type H+-transporting ATPase subunit a
VSAEAAEKGGMKTRTKVLLAIGGWLGIAILLGLIFGSSGKDESFKPQNDFKLEPWISIHIAGIDLSINKAVLYLAIAAGLTIAVMTWISRRMQREPNRVQMAIELGYDLTRNQIAGGNLTGQWLARWFPFCAALFFFIWFSNMIGYIPLPVNTEHTVDIFGVAVPTFSIYAATANISVPLMLTLIVWISYNLEGIRAQGFFGYFKSWLPPGLEDMSPFGKAAIFAIEAVSHFVRLISLSVRLFANILAGHLLILFMGGGLAVLLGIAALGVVTIPMAFAFWVFEVVLIATLQAFIFSILTAIYIGGATSASH